jgi:hypothetical protein
MARSPHASATRRLGYGRLGYGLGAVLVLLAAAHTVAWFVVTGRMETAFAAWMAGLPAAGWTAAAGPVSRTGWPTEAAIEVPNLVVSGATDDVPGGVTWRAERLRLAIAVTEPRLLRLNAMAAQHLRVGPLPEVGLTGERLEATVPLTGAASADLTGKNVTLALPAGAVGIATLAAHGAADPAAARGAPALALTASAEAIALPKPAGGTWALGDRIASVSFDAALSGPVPATTDLTARATAWRDGGGTLDLSRLALGWGPLGLSGDGTFTLDAHLQPAGKATAELVGFDATLDALASGGVLAPRVALAAKGVLGILARPPEGGGAPRVEVPVTLADRTLSAGGFPLVRMPQWVWP